MATTTTNTVRRSTPDGEFAGDYALLANIGSGGMATVFKARGPDGRVWALKEMRPQPEAHKEMARRFRQEFEVTSRLDHRNIVGVHDFFAAEETLHIVMEWVDGLDLRTVLHYAGTLDDGRLARVGVDVAAGMEHAHLERILHRDLKPENILLGRRGQVKIVDFGVARVHGTRLTATGIIVGSPAYMSPEQLAGVSGQELTEAADIYSFGVLLYELGEARDPLGLKKHEDLLTVLRAKRERPPRDFKRIADSELQALILACLDPDKDARPSSMEELRTRLLRIVRRDGARREDLADLARLADENRKARRRATGPAPRPGPPPSAGPTRESAPARPLRPAAAPPPPDPDWARPALPASVVALAPSAATAPRRAPPIPMAAPAAPAPAADAVAPSRGVARWFDQPVAEVAGEPRLPPELEDLGPSRSVTSGRTPSHVNDLSFETKKAGEAGVLSWLSLALFAAAVLFFGASASLTGSPLGLLERWIPLP